MRHQFHSLEEVLLGIFYGLVEFGEAQWQAFNEAVFDSFDDVFELGIDLVEFLEFESADGGEVAVVGVREVEGF